MQYSIFVTIYLNKNSNHINFCNFSKFKITILRTNIHKKYQIMITILITLDVLLKKDFA
jgi:hypothetical protein